jgi:endothelin-converting enzyme/putative endopeptidase
VAVPAPASRATTARHERPHAPARTRHAARRRLRHAAGGGHQPSPPLLVAERRTAPAPAVPGIDPASIDPKASPCQDFFAHACGGWIASHAIPADKPAWGAFWEVVESNRTKLRDLAEQAAAGKADPEDRFASKVGDYYAACMDEDAVERNGLAELRAEWRELEGVKDSKSLASAAGALHARGVSVLFVLASGQDNRDSTKVIAWVRQGGLSLPDRDYYLTDEGQNPAIRAAYRAHLERMLELAGTSKARARREAKAVFDLEKAVAESHWTVVEMREPERLYNPMDLAGLERSAPRFAWRAFLGAAGSGHAEAFSATTPKALTRLDELVRKTPPAAWRAYLRWHLLQQAAAARALPRAFVEEGFGFASRSFTGQKEMRPRWQHCVARTDDAIGEALGQAFVRRWFGGDARQKALELVRGIQAAQGRNLDGLAWMDPATRAKGKEKLAAIDNKIGYPARWRDYAALEVGRASHLRNVVAAAAFEKRRDLAKVGRPLDRSEWLMTPPEVNAYYEPQLNEMAFPAGILQPPFYVPGANDAVSYGAIGSIVGHELTHGFDDEGRKYDARGNQVDWWSPGVSREFERRAACVERQFAGYEAVSGQSVNGKLTLGENIADLGGLRLALAAYRASRAGKPPEADVAGLTPDQQFFLAHGQSWCSAQRPEYARMLAQVDPHAPERWRVNGPLSNLPEFAAAFGCKAGDPMVRSERCEVW